MTHVFGLTGGVASGKSTVAARFAEQGVPVIDADVLARQVVAKGSPGLAEIVSVFGSRVLTKGGELNRRLLGETVFADPSALQQLNAITHPRVATLFAARRAELAALGATLVCYDVPLLFERQLEAGLRPVVVVTASLETQVRRLITRDGLTREQALQRISSQLALSDKAARADYVIENDGSLSTTQARADEVLSHIRRGLWLSSRAKS